MAARHRLPQRPPVKRNDFSLPCALLLHARHLLSLTQTFSLHRPRSAVSQFCPFLLSFHIPLVRALSVSKPLCHVNEWECLSCDALTFSHAFDLLAILIHCGCRRGKELRGRNAVVGCLLHVDGECKARGYGHKLETTEWMPSSSTQADVLADVCSCDLGSSGSRISCLGGSRLCVAAIVSHMDMGQSCHSLELDCAIMHKL